MLAIKPLPAALVLAFAGMASTTASAELASPTPKGIQGRAENWPQEVPFPADSRWELKARINNPAPAAQPTPPIVSAPEPVAPVASAPPASDPPKSSGATAAAEGADKSKQALIGKLFGGEVKSLHSGGVLYLAVISKNGHIYKFGYNPTLTFNGGRTSGHLMEVLDEAYGVIDAEKGPVFGNMYAMPISDFPFGGPVEFTEISGDYFWGLPEGCKGGLEVGLVAGDESGAPKDWYFQLKGNTCSYRVDGTDGAPPDGWLLKMH